MKYLKLIRSNATDLALIGLIAAFFFMYFVIYMTPSRTAWYTEMRNQIEILYEELTTIGR